MPKNTIKNPYKFIKKTRVTREIQPNLFLMKTKCLLPLCFFTFLISFQLKAQQTISASGGEYSGAGGSVSCTTGQVAFQFNQGSGGTESQGVQQPFEIFIVTGTGQMAADDFAGYLVYPNPADFHIVLQSNGIPAGRRSWELFDVSGRLLKTGRITGTENHITM